jgi:hypothetical protein
MLNVSRSSVSKVMTSFDKKGKTPSAKPEVWQKVEVA